tara:strand:- start:728 stop:2011 length:1284 start_codon:yes stop_codon:yes gene_type:complete
MSDLQSLINKLKIDSASLQSYIYYDKPTGKIHKISSTNEPSDEYAIIAVLTEEAMPMLSGEKRTDEYVILYDISAKQIMLKEVVYEDSHITASTMCYQLPVIKNTYKDHVSLTSVYEGIDIYIWNIACSYNKGQFVWYNNNVYKLKTDIELNTLFDTTAHLIFVQDVYLTLVPTQDRFVTKLLMVPEYVGVHVDVWYKELSHLAGQHVWLNGTVYKLLFDQDADTEFKMDNVEVIISNVKLYADENKSLSTADTISLGNIILNNNNLYSIQEEKENIKDNSLIFFYTSQYTILYYNNKLELPVIPLSNIKNGQTILCGKNLYQLHTEKNYDIIVKQDTLEKCWKILLNPHTKKFLINSGHTPNEILYFSVTSKYDPNILYRSIEFSVGELMSDITSVVPFKYESENNATDVSIYTAKYFESYAHEII